MGVLWVCLTVAWLNVRFSVPDPVSRSALRRRGSLGSYSVPTDLQRLGGVELVVDSVSRHWLRHLFVDLYRAGGSQLDLRDAFVQCDFPGRAQCRTAATGTATRERRYGAARQPRGRRA